MCFTRLNYVHLFKLIWLQKLKRLTIDTVFTALETNVGYDGIKRTKQHILDMVSLYMRTRQQLRAHMILLTWPGDSYHLRTQWLLGEHAIALSHYIS